MFIFKFLSIFVVLSSIFIRIHAEQQIFTCQGSKLAIKCKKGEYISIKEAKYGYLGKRICGNSSFKSEVYCSTYKLPQQEVMKRCHMKRTCNMVVSNRIFGNPCRQMSKYLQVKYNCIKGMTMPVLFIG